MQPPRRGARRRAALLSAAAAAAAEPLRAVPALRSRGGELAATLRFGAGDLIAPGFAVLRTRVYNGGLPGPTLRVRRGDRLRVTLVNDLGADPPPPLDPNTFSSPNTTNLHVHGLHVSPEEPQDSVLIDVPPRGGVYRYDYRIPADHMGGTHWYHAHRHRSSTLQVGGGAAGMLIVEDDDTDVPALPPMDEVALILQYVPALGWEGDLAYEGLLSVAEASNDTLTHPARRPPQANVVLANGQYRPTLSVRRCVPTRLRLVWAAATGDARLSVQHPDGGGGGCGCTLQLIARDGVYLPSLPRPVGDVWLGAGARADVILRCARTCRGARLGSAGDSSTAFDGTAVYIDVAGPPGPGGGWCPPPVPDRSLAPAYPPYLRDTRAAEVPAGNAWGVAFERDMDSVCTMAVDSPVCGASGGPFDYTVRHAARVGELQQFALSGAENHPFHMHTHHVQLQETPQPEDPNFLGGDWVDTVFMPRREGSTGLVVTLRFWAYNFTGPLVAHCHTLAHEDQGCMMLAAVVGPRDDPGAACNATLRRRVAR